MGAVVTGTVPLGLLPHLRRARDHIDRGYRWPLDLDDLAAVAGVSKYHFARSFAATYGETPIRYLTRRRIERAQDLLRSANLTVTEICMAVGFSSLGSFSARFTALVGEIPAGVPQSVGRAGRSAGAGVLPVHLRRAGPASAPWWRRARFPGRVRRGRAIWEKRIGCRRPTVEQ